MLTVPKQKLILNIAESIINPSTNFNSRRIFLLHKQKVKIKTLIEYLVTLSFLVLSRDS